MTFSNSPPETQVNQAPKSRIKTDLAAGLGISICVLVAFCGLYLWKTSINNDRFNAIIMHQDCLSLGSRISLELEQQARFLLSLVYGNNADAQAKFLQSGKRVLGLMQRLNNIENQINDTIPQRIRLEFLKLQQISSHLNETASTIFNLMNAGQRKEAQQMLGTFTQPVLENEIHRQTLFFIDEGKENLEQARQQWRHQESLHAVIFNALATVFFVSILAVSTKVAKSILKTEHRILRESEEKYRAVFDNSHEGILITDTQGHILDANSQAAHLLGFEKNELLNGSLTRILPAREEDRSTTVLTQREDYLHDAQKLERKDGSTLWAEIDMGSFRLDGNQRSVVHVRDVTERKKAEKEREKLEAQLTQAQKMEAIATLAGGVAHDFNNLLTGIQGTASLMLMRLDSSHPHCAMLKTIEKLVQSGARLTSQLLGYARKGKYEPKPIDLNKVLEETSRTFGRTKKEITIHRELASELCTVEADIGQIEQVLLNLYVNAWQAMPGGGDLHLRTENVNLDRTFVKIDMVILDMIMPDMSGSETYDRLKEVNSGVKVLLSSGYSVDGQASDILKRGCNGFIQKPFHIVQLSQKVRHTIEYAQS